MRTRVETLLGASLVGLLDFDVSRAVRAPPAARGDRHRPAARLRHLRLVRSGRARQAGAQGPADRRQRRAAADGAVEDQPREEHDGRAGFLQVAGLEPARRTARQGVREIRAGPERQRRPRLRRSAAEGRRAARQGRARAREVRRAVPVRHGRRVSGHEPAAISPDSAARPSATATWRWSATPISRSIAGAAPTCATSSTSSTTFPKPRSSSSSGTIDRRRSFSTPRRPSSARTGIARKSGCGPSARAAISSSISADRTSSKRPTSSRARLIPASRARPTARWPCSTAPTRSRASSKTR